MKKALLILSALFFASFIFSACGDETYGYNTNTKKVEKSTFVAQNTSSQNVSNN